MRLMTKSRRRSEAIARAREQWQRDNEPDPVAAGSPRSDLVDTEHEDEHRAPRR